MYQEGKKYVNSLMARDCAVGNSPHKLEPLHGQTIGNLGRMRTYVIQRNLAKGPKRDIQKYPLISLISSDIHISYDPWNLGFLTGKTSNRCLL